MQTPAMYTRTSFLHVTCQSPRPLPEIGAGTMDMWMFAFWTSPRGGRNQRNAPHARSRAVYCRLPETSGYVRHRPRGNESTMHPNRRLGLGLVLAPIFLSGC